MLTIKIKDLSACTSLGVYDWEKQEKRLVVLNIELRVSCSEAANSDDIKDTVDYAQLEQKIIRLLESSSFNLLEKLVYQVGKTLLLFDPRIKKVQIEAEKPGALRQAKSVSICAEFLA